MTVNPFWKPSEYSTFTVISRAFLMLSAYIYSSPSAWYALWQRNFSGGCVVILYLKRFLVSVRHIFAALFAYPSRVASHDSSENKDKVETYLAFGATRFEACTPIAQDALRFALLPVINQMRYVGLPSLLPFYHRRSKRCLTVYTFCHEPYRTDDSCLLKAPSHLCLRAYG